MLCELTLTLIFWIWIYYFETDWSWMTRSFMLEKIYYDTLHDVENYNHWLPLALLMIEYWINNIRFSRKHFLITLLINTIYTAF